MPRPNRLELLAKFFPEMREDSIGADREASIRFNSLACEAILQDQINLFDRGTQQLGKGVLAVRINKDATCSDFVALEDLQADLELATTAGDSAIRETLDAVIKQIDTIDPLRYALILLIDNSGMRLIPVDRKKPAGDIRALLEEFAT